MPDNSVWSLPGKRTICLMFFWSLIQFILYLKNVTSFDTRICIRWFIVTSLHTRIYVWWFIVTSLQTRICVRWFTVTSLRTRIYVQWFTLMQRVYSLLKGYQILDCFPENFPSGKIKKKPFPGSFCYVNDNSFKQFNKNSGLLISIRHNSRRFLIVQKY